MTEEESADYIGGAVTPEVEETFGKAVDWVEDKAGDAVDWAKQEVTDIGQTIGQGIDTVETWVKENPLLE